MSQSPTARAMHSANEYLYRSRLRGGHKRQHMSAGLLVASQARVDLLPTEDYFSKSRTLGKLRVKDTPSPV